MSSGDQQTESTFITLKDIGSSNGDINHGSADNAVDSNHNIKNGYEDLSDEEVPLESASHQLSAQSAKQWRRAALIAAWASVILLLILGIMSFGVSTISASSAAFGFGFDCILDVGTSAVVIWRFYGSIGTLYSSDRERIALLFLGCLFIVASISILARAITDLIGQHHPKHGSILLILAAVSGIACTLLAVAKFIIAKKLNSRSIRTDGYSSLAGAVTSFSIIVTTKLIEADRHVWYLDAVVGVCVAFLLLFYGVKLLVDVCNESPVSIRHVCCQRCTKCKE